MSPACRETLDFAAFETGKEFQQWRQVIRSKSGGGEFVGCSLVILGDTILHFEIDFDRFHPVISRSTASSATVSDA